jgi:beta-lactamase regulating signal transducer with metallopeptidase domain
VTAALINHLWQSTLFCAAVWLVTLALRNNGAALRHNLWLIASLKFLVPFSVLYDLGASMGLPTLADGQPGLFAQAIAFAAPVVAPGGATVLLDTQPQFTWSGLFAAAWLTGVGVVALRWWLSWRAADSMARAARPVPGSSLDARVTDAAIEPAVARVFRPVVLLPSALLGRLTRSQLEAVLAHEREHITRRDNLVTHLQRLVETLFWFHPLVWWIGRQITEERERAVDEAVLDRGLDAREYAEGILAVCRHCHELSHLRGTSSALSGNLTSRIRGIIASAVPAAPGFFKTMMLCLCTLGVGMGTLFAGAVDGAARLRQQIDRDTLMLRNANLTLQPSTARGDDMELVTGDHEVVVRNATLRELVALAYDVSPGSVKGGGDWLDAPRYDVRAEVRDTRIRDDFEPVALRGAVNEILASRFDLQVHVNQRCQQPCGRRALLANHSP